MPETRATWFCIDIECNGPVPGLYDMVSLGAVVVAPTEEGALALGEGFYIEIKPQAPRFDAGAARVHGLDQADLAANGVPRRQAMERLSAWVAAQTRPGTEAVFVGHNAPFDWSFVAWVYHDEGLPNPFGYKALCTKSLAMGALRLHWLDTGKDQLSRLLNLPAEDTTQKHRADYDARYQAEILLGLLEHIGLG